MEEMFARVYKTSCVDFDLGSENEVKCHIPTSRDLILGFNNGEIRLLYNYAKLFTPFTTQLQHLGAVHCLALTPHETICISGSADHNIKLWDMNKTIELKTLTGHRAAVLVLAVADKGEFFVSGSEDKSVLVWELPSGCLKHRLEGHTDAVVNLLFLHDNTCVSASKDSTLKVWNVSTGQITSTLEGQGDRIWAVKFLPPNQLLSCSANHLICLWSLETMSLTRTYRGHEGTVRNIAVLPNKEFISISNDYTLRLWSLDKEQHLAILQGHTTIVTFLEVLRHSQFCISADRSGLVILWNLQERRQVCSFHATRTELDYLALSTCQIYLITAASEGKENKEHVKIWSLSARQELVQTLYGHVKHVLKLCVASNEESFYTLSFDQTIKRWSLQKRREIGSIEAGPKEDPNYALVEVNGTVYYGGEKCVLRHFNFENEVRGEFKLSYRIKSLLSSPDGKTLFVGSVGLIYLIDIQVPEEPNILRKVPSQAALVTSMVFATKSNMLFFASLDSTIHVWENPLNVEPLNKCVLKRHSKGVKVIILTANEETLISGSLDTTIKIWDVSTRKVLATLTGHTENVNSLALLFKDQFLLSASADKTIKLWSLSEYRLLTTYEGHTGSVEQVTVISNGSYFLSASQDASVRVWPVNVPWAHIPTSPEPAFTYELRSTLKSLKKGTRVAASTAISCLLPWIHMNGLHVSAFYNHTNRCKDYLSGQTPLLRGEFGSPLTVALERNTINCVDAILQHIIDTVNATRDDSAWSILLFITEDIPLLLMSKSRLLSSFFAVLMQPPASPPLQTYISPKSSLPMTQFAPSQYLRGADLYEEVVKVEEVNSGKVEEAQVGKVLVQYEISLLKWALEPGSKESLQLLEALEKCGDRKVLISRYASLIIEDKWSYFYPLTLALTFAYCVMLLNLSLILFSNIDREICFINFIIINGGFLAFELAQIITSFRAYMQDSWNFVDLTRGGLCLAWAIFQLIDMHADIVDDITLPMVMLCFLRGFTYFRTFKMTRVYVYMTIKVVKEVYSFLAILAYSTVAFGICLSVLTGHSTVTESWTTAFTLLMGEFDTTDFVSLEWVLFVCASIVNVIIMLNLLVSILGDAFEKTQKSIAENDLHLQIVAVLEYERLLFWRRCNQNSPATTLVRCEEAGRMLEAKERTGKGETMEKLGERLDKLDLFVNEKMTKIEKLLEALSPY